ncbi:MAG: type VI secretion system tube protein Hcp [Polyangiaceae bacterium]|nr:type VI secretion system tube protein Hcp [Polyangiaceae bacterium]
MRVKSAAQGVFKSDQSRAGVGYTLCLAVRFRGEVPHDVRGGNAYKVTQHEPITVIRRWSASTSQFLIAMWNNEVLTEVFFEFIQHDPGGKEVVFATMTLTKVTVVSVELRSGNTHELVESDHGALDVLGFHAEGIEFTFMEDGGGATAKYSQGG